MIVELSEQPTILVVDDTPESLKMLNACLREAGFRVAIAQSGAEALQRVAQNVPDLILLDVLMPGLDGFATCRQLKADAQTRDIPVIFVTALHETVDKLKGFEAGGVDYVTKPVQHEEVLARVNTHLTIRRLQQELHRHNEHLQELVADRTAELTRNNQHLQQEIVERTRIEAELRVSEQQYRALAEDVLDGIGIFQDGRLLFVNRALPALFGYAAAEFQNLIQTNPLHLLRPDFRAAGQERLAWMRARTVENPWWTAAGLTKDGREIWVEIHWSAIAWAGRPALLITARDITAAKQREIAIEAEKAELAQENRALRSGLQDRYKFGGIIGKSRVMQTVYASLVKAAASDASAVIYGESGTGKELAAQMIHQLSARRKHAFVAVNCGAVPEALFEREFFGHRKGAFTSADRDQSGYFDRAHKGTLFLDEIGELTPALQVKLLRVLQNGEYTPIGASASKTANVRIIAATNKPLKTLVRAGVMREDFFYRIRVMVINLPPLRERKEDLPLLVEHFLAIYNKNKSGESLSLPEPVMQALCSYDWPGNIRELQNELQRYLAQQRLDFLGDDQALAGMARGLPDAAAPTAALSFSQTVAAFEKALIARALAQANGHPGQAAGLLQIPPKTLYRKIREYGLRSK